MGLLMRDALVRSAKGSRLFLAIFVSTLISLAVAIPLVLAFR